jgi:hypothetical protein
VPGSDVVDVVEEEVDSPVVEIEVELVDVEVDVEVGGKTIFRQLVL